MERLTVMSVDELEGVLPLISAGAFTWEELLSRRFSSDHVVPSSIHQASYDIMKEKNKQFTQNAFLKRKTDEIFSKEIDRLKEINTAGNEKQTNG